MVSGFFQGELPSIEKSREIRVRGFLIVYTCSMPGYSEEIIQQLKAHADISTVLQRFIPLKKRGQSWVGLCPFHDDRTPSFHVTPHLGIYKCFACGAGGDVIKFVMEHERLDFTSAVQLIAEESGFPLPELGKVSAQDQEERGRLLHLNLLADQYFQQHLEQSAQAKTYLEERGILPATAQKFHLGFAPDSRDRLVAQGASQGFSPRELVQAGLAVERENGGVIDKFRNRLMFAIQNLSGKTVGFGGRILIADRKAPKYMNSPETELYHKSQILYGLNHARTAISKLDHAYVVEGYFDVLSLHQAGIENVVAVSGTALTDQHAKILTRYTQKVFLVFDGDAAGRKAALRSLEILLPTGAQIRTLLLPETEDPDSLVRSQGAEVFQNRVKQDALDFLELLQRIMPRETPEERSALMHEARRLIALIQDSLLRQEYLTLAAQRFGIRRQDFAAVKNVAKRKSAKFSQEAPLPSVTHENRKIPPLEQRFLNLLYRNAALWNTLLSWFQPWLFESQEIAEMIDLGLAQLEENQTWEAQTWFESLANQEQQFLLSLPEEEWNITAAERELIASLLLLSDQSLQRMTWKIRTTEPSTDTQKHKFSKNRLQIINLRAEINKAKLLLSHDGNPQALAQAATRWASLQQQINQLHTHFQESLLSC